MQQPKVSSAFPEGSVVAGYTVIKPLGSGGHGDVFMVKRGDQLFAMKVEKINTAIQSAENHQRNIRVKSEYDLYTGKLKGVIGVPTVFHYEIFEDNVHLMIMELLQHNLQYISNTWRACSAVETLSNVLMVARSVTTCLRNIHATNVIHRDIKPSNIMYCANGTRPIDTGKIYIVDLGVALHERTKRNATPKEREKRKRSGRLTGTTMFASMCVHRGHNHCERDDLESLVYSIIMLLHGQLPWSHIHEKDKVQRNHKVRQLKQSRSIDEICIGCPPSIHAMLRHARELSYGQMPDYPKMIALIERDMEGRAKMGDNEEI